MTAVIRSLFLCLEPLVDRPHACQHNCPRTRGPMESRRPRSVAEPLLARHRICAVQCSIVGLAIQFPLVAKPLASESATELRGEPSAQPLSWCARNPAEGWLAPR